MSLVGPGVVAEAVAALAHTVGGAMAAEAGALAVAVVAIVVAVAAVGTVVAVAVVGTVVAVVAVGTVVAVVVVVVTVGAVVVAGALHPYEHVPTLRVPYARPVQLPTVHCPPTHLSLRCAAGAACLLELQLLVVHWCLREWSWGRGLALIGLLLRTFSFFPSAVCACSRVQLKCCLCRVFVYTLAPGSFGVFFSPHALAGSERSVCG